ncbi:sensor histidine kinase [Actinoallomurus rhizosphaericola]|uniref:sensor histidine kinase n=1 Tax=Actinoallomurus rhizosphaericola TaxID=2952536 RepID=UPI00209045A1|nr:histidine kinase [Actinoallomurus rhizosphaericola]MCO5994582.1 histidine kinase [Actinoallomurus rhizosphaericola]
MGLLDRLMARPGAAVNAVLGIVFAAALGYEIHLLRDRHDDWALTLAAGAVVSAAALVRERSRTWAAAVGLAVAGVAEAAAWRWGLSGEPSGAAILALGVLIASAVRVLPVRTAAAVAAGGAVVVAGSLERYSHFLATGAPVSYSATWIMAQGWVAIVGAGLVLRRLDARREAAIDAVRRDERLELARELHDSAAHHITGVVLQAQGARIAARRSAAGLDDALAGIEAAATEALASMRQVIGLLREADDPGGPAPGPEALTDLVERFARRGPAVRLDLPDGPPDPAWPPEVTATVYRVVQESLTNITRYASGAGEVIVALTHDRRDITVEVTDDASPAGSPRFPHSGGYGLVGMRERVEALGGTLVAGPRPWAGWSVRASLPVPSRS